MTTMSHGPAAAVDSSPINRGLARNAGPLAAIAGVASAAAATACCVVPLALFAVGISGAWIGNLTALSPYQPFFVLAALLAIGSGHVWARRYSAACNADGSCATPRSMRRVRIGLWTATSFALASVVVPYLAAALL